MVKVDFRGVGASIDGGVWSSSDDALVSLLDSFTPLYGLSGADPNPDMTLAENAISLLGGTITEAQETEHEEGVIY